MVLPSLPLRWFEEHKSGELICPTTVTTMGDGVGEVEGGVEGSAYTDGRRSEYKRMRLSVSGCFG